MKRIQILSTATALLFVATAAQAQRRQDDHNDRQDQHRQVAPQAQPRPHDGNPGRGVEDAQRRGFDQARPGQARAEEQQNQQRIAQANAQQRELQSREREQAAELERARQSDDRDRVIEAQRRAEVDRAYVHDRDYRPVPVYAYRYRIGGVYRETNEYGVGILRQAVNFGYQRGYDAGLQDLRAGVAPNYQLAFDYQSGNYGFTPDYIPESDYSYYFRQGFQRGYDDAYWGRAQYGTYYNGTASILGDVMTGILGLTMMH